MFSLAAPVMYILVTPQFRVMVRFKNVELTSCPSPSSDFCGHQMAHRKER